MSKRLWGGRFHGALDPRLDACNRSFGFDRRLYREDIRASVAWAKALRLAGLLTDGEHRTIRAGLGKVLAEFEQGRFVEDAEDEDIHTAVERRLVELVGTAGEKLHTGRSRNDQVATDLLLWLREAHGLLLRALRDLAEALLAAAVRAEGIAMPAYTHLQRAQPVLLAHQLLAYVEMVARDRERLLGARRRCETMPLGSGAATGTGFAIDRRALAKDLGFREPSGNSLDAVGSRDAALEFLAAGTILAVHLSRLGEEIVLWTSPEFGFARLDDRASTGSSLLPQKRNPDGAELARGKAGRVCGDFVTLATVMKGLPLAYNKDLQEDKEAVFDASDTLLSVLGALAATLEGVSFDADRCAAALSGGHVLATELADYLVRKGVPFRRAHTIVGGLVREAESRGVDVADLPLDVLRSASPEFREDVRRAATVPAALAARRAVGGTAPAQVRRALARWRRRVATW